MDDVKKNDDFIIKLFDNDILDNQSIIDTFSNKNVRGYLIKDNMLISIHKANRDIALNHCSLEYYYYENVGNRTVKVRTMDSYYFFDDFIYIVPIHSSIYLKSINDFVNKVFIIKINYDVVYNDIENISTNSNTSLFVNDDGQYVEHRVKEIYFKSVSDAEFEAYKKNKEELNSFTIKKNGPIDLNNSK